MIPNLFILSSTGEVLIEKQWQSRHRRAVCDLYWEESQSSHHLIHNEILNQSVNQSVNQANPSTKEKSKDDDESDQPTAAQAQAVHQSATQRINRSEMPPIISTPRLSFVSIIKNNITFLTVCEKDNSSAPFLTEFLQKIVAILMAYINDISENLLRENFSTVYQILDEMVDGGFPSVTELNVLKELVPVPSLANKLIAVVTDQSITQTGSQSSAASKIPWRAGNVRYVQNEIYFDLVEQLDCILTAQGNVIAASVYGEISCTCRLSGMPDLTLTFTRPSLLEDASLHRCVRIARYQKERCLSFVPPDGQFNLCSYRVPGTALGTLPIYVKPSISFRGTSGRVQIMMGSKLSADKPVTNCMLTWFFPVAVKSHTITANIGTFRIDQRTGQARWDIGRLAKDITPMLQGNVTLESDVGSGHHEITIVEAQFTIKLVSASGLKVEGLAIRNVNYAKPFKGVRSVTQAGKFQIRCID